MRLAINYSPAAANLVKAGQIEIDYFKTPDWDWIIKEASLLKPVAVHFTLEAGNNSLGDVDWEKIERVADLTSTPFINLHLDARQSYYPEYRVDSSVISEVEAVSRAIMSDVGIAVERFGPQRVIIENSPYRGMDGNTMQLCVLPELITQVVDETGCGLLLDLSHAVITAEILGMDPQEYISRLPVQRVNELHFAGIHRSLSTGQLTDHLSIQEDNWQWLDWALMHIKSGEWGQPWLLAFEYGGVGEQFEWRSSPQVILEQVPMLNEHIKILDDDFSG